MRTIMLATDLSPRAHHALERSVALATDNRAALVIVHVVDEDLPGGIAEEHRRLAVEVIEERLAAVPGAAGIDYGVHVLVGRVGGEILRLAEASRAELIVLGTHRAEPVTDFFRGATAERLIRAGKLPILVTARPVRGPYRRVIVGVDFSVCSRRAVECAAALMPDAELFLVHAYEVPFRGFLYGRETAEAVAEEHERQLTAMINDEMQVVEQASKVPAPLFKRIARPGRAEEVLRAECDHLKPDLLVVGTHGRTGVAHALLGSVAESLLAEPPCDVLAVKAW